ncbi:MAG: hypothetical protein ACI9WU_001430 [Myxococcota bacterium]|jgi:hypothetical protein
MKLHGVVAAVTVLISVPAYAGFDWGSDCSEGAGEFEQFTPLKQLVTVGEIPANKKNVKINLSAAKDVDVQLIDKATGYEIVAWPSGQLNGPAENCGTFDGVTYCYSGFNGGQTIGTFGNEWIEIHGVTNRELIMRAYGYAAGVAQVTYSWESESTCTETGDGQFAQWVEKDAVVTVGDIPSGKFNVVVDLQATDGKDVDVQLYDGGVALVQWPNGQLSGPTSGSLEYQGMTITWSGYNGLGGNWGHERIQIKGLVTRTLTMKAFGYAAGFASVEYSWGGGVGQTCMGIAALQCQEELACKEVQTGVADAAGVCHTPNWCDSDASAQVDCSNLFHIAVPGAWQCPEHVCQFVQGAPSGGGACTGDEPDLDYKSLSKTKCQVIKFACPAGSGHFSNACGCGCKAN